MIKQSLKVKPVTDYNYFWHPNGGNKIPAEPF